MDQKNCSRLKYRLARLTLFLAASAALPASSLFVGFNTLTPVQIYSETGQYLQDFGPPNAISAFPDASGYVAVTPAPDYQSSIVTEYSRGMSEIGSFKINDLITDGAVEAGTLLLSGNDGSVYRVSPTGSILNSWSTGYSHVGVTSDGSYVYTTQGDGGNLLDVWSNTGTLVRQIATPYVGLYGLGFDSSTGDFWAGSSDYVYQISASGAALSTLDLSGEGRTPNGAVHDGLEVGDVPITPPVTTPEPASMFLLPGGLLVFFVYKRRRAVIPVLAVVLTGLGASSFAFGAVKVTLTPSVPSGAPVGSTITWKASASDTASSSATLTYQFKIGAAGGAMQVRRDFYTYNTFPWTPMDSEGSYNVEVTVKSSTGSVGVATASYDVTSRITGNSPVVSRTNHPLVALYSMPPCAAGHTARVRFKLPFDTTWQATSLKTCNGTGSLNFYIAGMRATTTYQLQQDVYAGPFDTIGPVLSFTTGTIPAGVLEDRISIAKSFPAPNSSAYPVLLLASLDVLPYAIDTTGHVIWYLPQPDVKIAYMTRPRDGGTFFVLTFDNSGIATERLLREYDLAGNLVWETNYAAVSAQLVARGADPVTTFHHDNLALSDGSIVLLGSVEKVADQGKGPVDVLGDEVIVLDSNLQVKFSWNEWDHLDIMRPAVLGETCPQGSPGCPHLTNPKYSIANDWTHSNALWDTSDGNLMVSIRHQDWIVKFQYENGAGDGAILWKLGKDGDFQVKSSDPYPWFSHQHNTEFQANGLLTLFDNGNTRVKIDGGGFSRGQAWQVDEMNKVATPVVNINFGVFSSATGSAQLLSNGNYTFNLGFVGSSAETREYTPAGALVSEADSLKNQFPTNSYRSFRMRSLYREK